MRITTSNDLKDKLIVSGDGVFASFQGEGSTIGRPAVFLRLQLCNLHCRWCDTYYTWDKNSPDYLKEQKLWTIKETVSEIKKAWKKKFFESKGKRLVITGGEPLIQQEKLIKLVSLLSDWEIEIETNGTIKTHNPLKNRCQFNVSPKLDNSGNSVEIRYSQETLSDFSNLDNSWFKFVVVTPDDFNEIDQIVTQCCIPTERVIIMAEGNEEAIVKRNMIRLLLEIKKRGFRILPRLQLILFGPKRRT